MPKSIKTRTPCSIVGGDFSGQEPRSLCAFALDKDMQNAYKKSLDLYATIASKCFKNSYWEDIEFKPMLEDCEEHDELIEQEKWGEYKLLITDKVYINNNLVSANDIKVGNIIQGDDCNFEVESVERDFIYINLILRSKNE